MNELIAILFCISAVFVDYMKTLFPLMLYQWGVHAILIWKINVVFPAKYAKMLVLKIALSKEMAMQSCAQ